MLEGEIMFEQLSMKRDSILRKLQAAEFSTEVEIVGVSNSQTFYGATVLHIHIVSVDLHRNLRIEYDIQLANDGIFFLNQATGIKDGEIVEKKIKRIGEMGLWTLPEALVDYLKFSINATGMMF